MFKDLHKKEREVLTQLYNNDADVIKYLPFFFSNPKQLAAFFDMFGGKTLKLPKTLKEFTEMYSKVDSYSDNRRIRGINGTKIMKKKVLESYINLFPNLESLIQNEINYSKED